MVDAVHGMCLSEGVSIESRPHQIYEVPFEWTNRTTADECNNEVQAAVPLSHREEDGAIITDNENNNDDDDNENNKRSRAPNLARTKMKPLDDNRVRCSPRAAGNRFPARTRGARTITHTHLLLDTHARSPQNCRKPFPALVLRVD